MHNDAFVLGIDTSNYTTSAAICDVEGRILSDRRRLLSVKEGSRGLRQQEALFQHVGNLPEIYSQVLDDIGGAEKIRAVCVSKRPRPVEGSYMPCFNAGLNMARIISTTLNVPLYTTSHQEGHLAAAEMGLSLDNYIFCHLSGGTCEFIDSNTMEIVGGSLDISFGQLLDRTGVARNIGFPCGRALDEIALNTAEASSILTKVKCRNGYFNLSGIETQMMRSELSDENVKELFIRITECLCNALNQLSKKRVLLAGGVSSSRFLRDNIKDFAGSREIYFGRPELCTDNAVGVALIGGRLWRQNR